MTQGLEIVVERIMRDPLCKPAIDLNLFISGSPDANKIRTYFERNTPYLYLNLENYEDWLDSDWEILYSIYIKSFFCKKIYLTSWNKASAKKRLNHSNRVAGLARRLAAALEEQPSPRYLSALAYFNEEPSRSILQRLKFEEDGATADDEEEFYGFLNKAGIPTLSVLRSPALALHHQDFLASQSLTALLENLANYAEAAQHEPIPDARPNTGNVEVRVFARSVATFFKTYFGRTPDEIIAATVALRFPDLAEPPTADQVRAWRGAR